MNRIGILGSGRVATALATRLATAGHDVTIGTRNVAGTSAKWTGPAVTFAAPPQTAREASLIINATPGDTSLERLGALREALDGKILVDVSNATRRGAEGLPAGLSFPDSSLAEHLQHALPGTRVVKTLNTMLFSVMVNPRGLAHPPTAFLSGNDEGAKATVRQLLHDLGWPPDWIEDLGDISTARGAEALILLVPHILRGRGFAPFALTVAR
ncbi:NAD(P)-binding domain-containing protein [Archangium violaceum]|uniref:NADPH-dependent F420 reductase n=1 Tax=Archangium violaceum TaxID=83451 RepID=UPI00193C8659|nr:NAD(P)-binding domain-containing protein [Archangium violaceum]QRK09295.1 NAD(P)-binding domain-containing protein [Archangium violaceum]